MLISSATLYAVFTRGRMIHVKTRRSLLIGYGNVARRFVTLARRITRRVSTRAASSPSIVGVVTRRHGRLFDVAGLDRRESLRRWSRRRHGGAGVRCVSRAHGRLRSCRRRFDARVLVETTHARYAVRASRRSRTCARPSPPALTSSPPTRVRWHSRIARSPLKRARPRRVAFSSKARSWTASRSSIWCARRMPAVTVTRLPRRRQQHDQLSC